MSIAWMKHAPYVVAAILMGLGWLVVALPRRIDRDSWTWLVFVVASLALAIAARHLVTTANGWKLWALGAVVPLVGHIVVMWGIGLTLAARGELPEEPLLDGVIKLLIILPLVTLIRTVLLFPVFAPLGVLYVLVLRWSARLSA